MRPRPFHLFGGRRNNSSQRLGRLSCSMEISLLSDRIVTAPFSKKNDKAEGNRFLCLKQLLFWDTTARGDAARIQASGFALGDP